MKKIILSLVAASVFPLSSTAALVNDGSLMLSIDAGTPECIVGGIYPSCDFGVISVSGGSYFTLDDVSNTVISGGTGILLGTSQAYDGNLISDSSPYNGSGNNITDVWSFFGKSGTNYSIGPISAISNTEIDMSSWRMAWDTSSGIYLGSGGVASISCGACNVGDTYTLDYTSLIPVDDSSGLGGIGYNLHLEGSIKAVPIPTSLFLFGSGLIGLMGLAKRKKL